MTVEADGSDPRTVKEHQGLPAVPAPKRKTRKNLYYNLQREHGPSNTLISTYSFRNCEAMHSVMAISYGSSWTCLTYVLERAESSEKDRRRRGREGGQNQGKRHEVHLFRAQPRGAGSVCRMNKYVSFL